MPLGALVVSSQKETTEVKSSQLSWKTDGDKSKDRFFKTSGCVFSLFSQIHLINSVF